MRRQAADQQPGARGLGSVAVSQPITTVPQAATHRAPVKSAPVRLVPDKSTSRRSAPAQLGRHYALGACAAALTAASSASSTIPAAARVAVPESVSFMAAVTVPRRTTADNRRGCRTDPPGDSAATRDAGRPAQLGPGQCRRVLGIEPGDRCRYFLAPRLAGSATAPSNSRVVQDDGAFRFQSFSDLARQLAAFLGPFLIPGIRAEQVFSSSASQAETPLAIATERAGPGAERFPQVGQLETRGDFGHRLNSETAQRSQLPLNQQLDAWHQPRLRLYELTRTAHVCESLTVAYRGRRTFRQRPGVIVHADHVGQDRLASNSQPIGHTLQDAALIVRQVIAR